MLLDRANSILRWSSGSFLRRSDGCSAHGTQFHIWYHAGCDKDCLDRPNNCARHRLRKTKRQAALSHEGARAFVCSAFRDVCIFIAVLTHLGYAHCFAPSPVVPRWQARSGEQGRSCRLGPCGAAYPRWVYTAIFIRWRSREKRAVFSVPPSGMLRVVVRPNVAQTMPNQLSLSVPPAWLPYQGGCL